MAESHTDNPAPRRRVRFSIRLKIVAVLTGVLLVTMTINGWLLLRDQRQTMLKEIETKGHTTVRYVSQSLVYSVVGYDYHTIQLLLNELASNKDIVYAVVKSRSGNTMAKYGSRDSENHYVREFRDPITADGDKVGEVILGITTKPIVDRIDQQKVTLITRELLTILVIALGEFAALSLLIVRPVVTIANFLDRNVGKDGSIRKQSLPIQSSDEFGTLATMFNGMMERLDDARSKLNEKINLADRSLQETNEKLQSMNAELQRLSYTDMLSGLMNRRRFDQELDGVLKYAARYGEANSIILMDIDRFKRINDTYGHDVGDEAIKVVSSILRDNVRETDLVARYGGEEFVILCRGTGRDEAVTIADKLRRMIEQTPIATTYGFINVTTSAGVTSLGRLDEAPEKRELLRRADAALYYSKEHGRNMTTHDSDIEVPNGSVGTMTPEEKYASAS